MKEKLAVLGVEFFLAILADTVGELEVVLLEQEVFWARPFILFVANVFARSTDWKNIYRVCSWFVNRFQHPADVY